MPLRFLVPAFLAGLLALAIPLLVHLTRRRKAERVPFPSLMFLERVPYRSESRRRIHHWLLLLLRAAAVALVVAAFARPFLDDPEVAAAGDGGPREVVLLVDRSYSMEIGDRWERAVAAAGSALDDMGPLDRATLVLFDDAAEVAVRSTSDSERIRRALDEAGPGDRATRYGPGLKLARAVLDESELPGREVVLVGDFQRAGWAPDDDVRFPPGTRIVTVPVGGEAPANRAVADVRLDRERFEGRERVTPTARLVRTGGEEAEEVEAVLEVDGREVARRAVTLPPSGSENVAFDAFTLSERHTRGTVRLAEDALPGDDAFHFVLSPGEALPVVILEAAGGRGASSLYLDRALRAGGGAGFDVRVRRGGVDRTDLPDRGVVVVNDRALSVAEGRALVDFLGAGGGVVLVLGEEATWPEPVADALPGTVGEAADRTGGRGGRIGRIDYDHPVFEIFRGPRTGDFTVARFFRARSFRPDGAEGTRVLARYDDGSPALVEGAAGEGRVLVWTSTLDAFWNDLALQPVFLPFVHRLVRHASGGAEQLSSFTAGQVIDVTDARAMETAGLGEAAAVLEEGRERVALTPRGASVDLDRVSYLELEERGFYRVRPPGADDVRPLAVAVNTDRSEAELAPLDPVEVAATLTSREGTGEGVVTSGGAAGAAALRLEERERRQSLWRFLLLGAFALLAVETVLSNRIGSGGGRGSSRPSGRAGAVGSGRG